MRKKTKKNRKVAAVILAAFMVSVLSACGSSNTSEKKKMESDTKKNEIAVYETAVVENGEISIDTDTLTSMQCISITIPMEPISSLLL